MVLNMNIKLVYKGIGFIKTRKSDEKAERMKEELIQVASKNELKLLDVIVDDSSGNDIDRENIDLLLEVMEKEVVKALVVRSVFDITKDVDDLVTFFRKAEELDVSIYTMELGFRPAYIPWDGGFGC